MCVCVGAHACLEECQGEMDLDSDNDENIL